MSLETVDFPESSTVDAVEASLLARHKNDLGILSPRLLLNFSRTAYFDVPALLQLISLLTQRSRASLITRVVLPEKDSARAFLRVWEFGDAVENAIGTDLRAVMSEEDAKFLAGDRQNALLRCLAASNYDGGLQRLLSRRFFSICTFLAQQSPVRRRIALDESERWQQDLIRAVLDRHLGHSDEFVGSRIVYEACTNALRHPGARIIQTASSFRVFGKTASARATGYLTIAFWDDGASMVETLNEAIRAGKTVQALRIPALYADYWVSVHDSSGQILDERPVRSDFVPNVDTSEEMVLLAATFPGITRDALGLDRAPNRTLQKSRPDWDAPGMGLYVLINTAVDIFGGRVTFRTKRWRLTVSQLRGNANARYSAKVTRYDTDFPSFLGNMVTIRLPIDCA